jgi:hypothetical protein
MLSMLSSTDLHLNNIAVAVPFLDGRSEQEVLDAFGPPRIGKTECLELALARFLGNSVPAELVEPGSLELAFVVGGRVLDEALIIRVLDFEHG